MFQSDGVRCRKRYCHAIKTGGEMSDDLNLDLNLNDLKNILVYVRTKRTNKKLTGSHHPQQHCACVNLTLLFLKKRISETPHLSE